MDEKIKHTENKSINKTISIKPYVRWAIAVFVFLFLTLPFHYIPDKMMMFPKENLTFNYTIITENDIDNIIRRYNKASIFEKQAIRNEPLVRKLFDRGVLVIEEP